MGLIKAALGAAQGLLADQWREYFYCDALPQNVLVRVGTKRTGNRSSNTQGTENVISNGSIIAVADGQCMLIVDNGRVAEICAEPGEFTYDSSTEPSLFYGNLGQNIGETFKHLGKRFTFGGEPPKDQRVYYINTKELMGNKYGTVAPVPFRVVDTNIGLDIDISVKCHGEYSYKITDPILFYTNVCGNISADYTREQIDSQLKSDLLTKLQPLFGQLSAKGIRYSMITAHTDEMSKAMNQLLSEAWGDKRGISIVSFGVSGVKANEEDEALIKELQRNATFRNPAMANAHLVGATATAMQSAAANTATGPAMAFMGMGMAQNMGAQNMAGLYGAQQQYGQPMQGQPQQNQQYGQPMQGQPQQNQQYGQPVQGQPQQSQPTPAPSVSGGWTCACGAANNGKFCAECGKPRPIGEFVCDKCGWKPSDPNHLPKFCPECGDVFDENDRR